MLWLLVVAIVGVAALLYIAVVLNGISEQLEKRRVDKTYQKNLDGHVADLKAHAEFKHSVSELRRNLPA